MLSNRLTTVVLIAVAVGAMQIAQAPRTWAGQDQTATAPDPMQIARGASAWAGNCGRCHNLRDPKEFSDKNWDVIVNHMRAIAPLPGEVARDVKAFLKATN